MTGSCCQPTPMGVQKPAPSRSSTLTLPLRHTHACPHTTPLINISRTCNLSLQSNFCKPEHSSIRSKERYYTLRSTSSSTLFSLTLLSAHATPRSHEHLVWPAGRWSALTKPWVSHREYGLTSVLELVWYGSSQDNRLSVCAGLLDSVDLSGEGGPHRGGEGAAREQCEPGTSRYGESIECSLSHKWNSSLWHAVLQQLYYYCIIQKQLRQWYCINVKENPLMTPMPSANEHYSVIVSYSERSRKRTTL